MNATFIGIVENGELTVLSPQPAPSGGINFTSIGMQESVSPESGQLDLTKYEGSVIAIQGHDAGGWVYSASVIDTAGPILTAVALKVFGK